MWIELHDGVRDHPKILKLARDLEIKPVQALGHMASLWTWTLRMAPDGCLASFDDEDIELAAQWGGAPGAFLRAAVARRLIDNTDGSKCIHHWDDFCGSLKARERKRIERTRHATVTRQSRDSHAMSRDVTQTDRPTDRPNERTNRLAEDPMICNAEKKIITNESDLVTHGVNLSDFIEQIAKAGLQVQLGKSDRERYSKLVPVEQYEIDHALEAAKGKLVKANYVLAVIEGERQRAALAKDQPPAAPPQKWLSPREQRAQEEAEAQERARLERKAEREQRKPANS